jgi:hypothetical protein
LVGLNEANATKLLRDLPSALDAAGIGIASATSEIVGFPPLRIERVSRTG